MTRYLLASCCMVALLAGQFNALAADAASDRDMAARYSSAATAGDDRAQFYLGALYSAGVGVPQSDVEAFGWITRAAERGHSQAMLVLAGLLAIGRGAPKDNVAAYKWAYIVKQGSRVYDLQNGASQLVALLETRMTAAQIASAKAQADGFRAVPSTAPRPPAATGASPAPQVSAPPQTVPAPQAAQAAPAQPATTTAAPTTREMNTGSDERPKSGRNSDIDRLLDNVPQNLRKRYGF